MANGEFGSTLALCCGAVVVFNRGISYSLARWRRFSSARAGSGRFGLGGRRGPALRARLGPGAGLRPSASDRLRIPLADGLLSLGPRWCAILERSGRQTTIRSSLFAGSPPEPDIGEETDCAPPSAPGAASEGSAAQDIGVSAGTGSAPSATASALLGESVSALQEVRALGYDVNPLQKGVSILRGGVGALKDRVGNGLGRGGSRNRIGHGPIFTGRWRRRFLISSRSAIVAWSRRFAGRLGAEKFRSLHLHRPKSHGAQDRSKLLPGAAGQRRHLPADNESLRGWTAWPSRRDCRRFPGRPSPGSCRRDVQ